MIQGAHVGKISAKYSDQDGAEEELEEVSASYGRGYDNQEEDDFAQQDSKSYGHPKHPKPSPPAYKPLLPKAPKPLPHVIY